MNAVIDPTARIAESARLAPGVEIGPYSVIGPGVEVGEGTRIGPHCVLEGPSSLGPECVLTSHVSFGTPPQDLKYAGEPTRLAAGARNVFREFVTCNRGTAGGGGLTVIGDDNLFMTGSHVAHDCRVGSKTIFANNATLGGHVEVGDAATIGAFTAVHQFCRIGRHAFLGGFTVVTKDVLPFMKTVGSRGDVKAYGANKIGLERKGFSPEAIESLQAAYRRLRAAGGLAPAAVRELRGELGGVPEVEELLAFVATARAGRGIHL